MAMGMIIIVMIRQYETSITALQANMLKLGPARVAGMVYKMDDL